MGEAYDHPGDTKRNPEKYGWINPTNPVRIDYSTTRNQSETKLWAYFIGYILQIYTEPLYSKALYIAQCYIKYANDK